MNGEGLHKLAVDLGVAARSRPAAASAEALREAIMARVQRLDPSDVRVNLPIFLEDLWWSPARASWLQTLADSEATEWRDLRQHAMLLHTDPRGAAEKGAEKLSAAVKRLEAARVGMETEGHATRQKKTKNAMKVAGGAGGAASGGSGKRMSVVGGAGGDVNMTVSEEILQSLSGQLKSAVLEAVRPIQESMQQSLQALSQRVERKETGWNAIKRELGQLPGDVEAKDKHTLEESAKVLDKGYEVARILWEDNPGVEGLGVVAETMELLLAFHVRRFLGVQKGFASVDWEVEKFVTADDRKRMDMIAEARSKPERKKSFKLKAANGGEEPGPKAGYFAARGFQGASTGPWPMQTGWESASFQPQQFHQGQFQLPQFQQQQFQQPQFHPVLMQQPEGVQTAPRIMEGGKGWGGTCKLCGGRGHWARECSLRKCWGCGQPGQTKATCTSAGCVRARGGSTPQ